MTILNKPWTLSLLSGLSVFLAFEQFGLVPLILFFPWLFNSMILSSENRKQAFALGFFTSFIIMLGGFYWVVYVIHEFGNLSWVLSSFLFLCFCGFGALNFPVFAVLAQWANRRILRNPSSALEGFWYVLGLPALFTLCEWAIPKLFPWYVGHAFYRQLWLIQICEITGATFLTFSLFSIGSFLGWFFNLSSDKRKSASYFSLIPLSFLCLLVGFSSWTLTKRVFPAGREIKVALIQANIGNLDKFRAKSGVLSAVDHVLKTYEEMTREILPQKPDLILWPETAIPIEMDRPSLRQNQIHQWVKEWGVPLIAGAYATSPGQVYRNYNSAFLLDPVVSPLRTDVYNKNILLAFGEYLPLGDTFPILYRTFPQVSDFARGHDQNIFHLSDGSRLGISICYEAIVPSFMRKVGGQGVHALVNLTNDSWFGPTSEPHLHGALTVFRAIEHRAPLMRVTNTGSSFTVSHLGQMSSKSGVYKAESSLRTVTTNASSPTFYGLYGDWFVLMALFVLAGMATFVGRTRETVSD